MRFHLSDEQEQLRDAILRYAVEQGAAGARRTAFEGESGFDAAFWAGLMEMGLGGLALPAEQGGMGLELIDLAIAADALGFAGAPGPFLCHALAGLAIAWAGDEEQRAQWLPRLASGEIIGTIALAEAADAWRPESWACQLVDGRLTGAKANVPYAELADILIVGVEGGGLALVQKGAAGMSAAPLDVADRTRRLCDVSFDGTPAVRLSGNAEIADRLLDAGLVLLAADACGGAQFLLDLSSRYACERNQFGGPIGRFQGLKFQLANMAVRVEPMRPLVWYAAHAFDHVQAERPRIAALAKAHAAECFMQTARDAIEAHGGIGYTWEYDAQIWFKRAMFDYAYLGSPTSSRARAAALAGW